MKKKLCEPVKSITVKFHYRYTGRGLFLDPPTVFLCNNIWNISLPEGLQSHSLNYGEISEFFSLLIDKLLLL